MTDRLTKSLIIVYRLPCNGGFFKTSQKAWRISPVKGKNVMPFLLRFTSVLMLQSGSEGFGYDPLFIPEGSAKTYAEMDPAEKNALSHRGRAVRKLAEFLHNRGK